MVHVSRVGQTHVSHVGREDSFIVLVNHVSQEDSFMAHVTVMLPKSVMKAF